MTMLCRLTLASLFLGACATDLGECPPFGPRDNAVRSDIVYFSNNGSSGDGIAMYAGQAIIQQSCGNGGFCHSPGISRSARNLVPAGIDFNVAPACTSEAACPDEDVDRLRENQATLFRWSELAFQEIQDGTMPPAGLPGPGEPGSVFPSGGYFRDVEIDGDTLDIRYADPLPRLYAEDAAERAQARSLVRDWLACGAPVVERLEEPVFETPEQWEALEAAPDCGADTVGQCIVRGPVTPPDPTWSSIFETVIVNGGCQGCHLPDSAFFEDAVIDYSDEATALAEMLNRPAAGSECVGGDGVLIVPGDPDASLFVEKFGFDAEVSCGDRMPLGGSAVPATFLPPIRQWIMEGANAN